MKIQPAVRRETIYVAIGTLAGSAVMLLVFFFLQRLDSTVVLGALLGSAGAILNFFLMGLSVQHVTDSQMDPQLAARYMKSRYSLRMLLMAAVIVLGVIAPCFHLVAVIIPFFLPQITAFVRQSALKKEAGAAPADASNEPSGEPERGEN